MSGRQCVRCGVGMAGDLVGVCSACAPKPIRVPQDATLEQAAAICADHFLLFMPENWPDLHAKAKRAGFGLVPAPRIVPQPGDVEAGR